MSKLFFAFALIFYCLNPIFSQKEPTLRAVLVVGHLEDDTQSNIEKMENIRNFLIKQGVKVQTFYGEKAIWADIAKASNGANFFIYRGHGTQSGENNGWGGLVITGDASGAKIAKLRFAPNALVLFQSVCGGAGSSASDTEDIGIKEAYKRVNEYSSAFFKAGAGAYFAINTDDGVLSMLTLFFAGKTLQETYNIAAETFYKIEFKRALSKENPNVEISIASSSWSGTSTRTTYINGQKTVEEVPTIKSYSIAYIAPANFSLKDIRVKNTNVKNNPNLKNSPTIKK